MKRPRFKIQMTDAELDRYSVAQDKYIDYLEERWRADHCFGCIGTNDSNWYVGGEEEE